MKKVLYFLCAVLMATGVLELTGVFAGAAFADDNTSCERYFLALKSWDTGLVHDSSCNVIMDDTIDTTEFVWTIILNIVYDLFVAVGTIAVAYIIYAGYAFLTSGGDPGKAAKARKSLVSSIAGILLSLSATVLVNTISDFIKPSTDPYDVLMGALNLAYAVVGTIAVGFIVYGGITYTTSSGDPGKARKGRQVLIYALIGLLVVLLAAGITNAVIGAM